MPSVKCTLKDCAYKNRSGYCKRKSIVLQVTRDDCNELYCLGWVTPETKLFIDAINATSGGITRCLTPITVKEDENGIY